MASAPADEAPTPPSAVPAPPPVADVPDPPPPPAASRVPEGTEAFVQDALRRCGMRWDRVVVHLDRAIVQANATVVPVTTHDKVLTTKDRRGVTVPREVPAIIGTRHLVVKLVDLLKTKFRDDEHRERTRASFACECAFYRARQHAPGSRGADAGQWATPFTYLVEGDAQSDTFVIVMDDVSRLKPGVAARARARARKKAEERAVENDKENEGGDDGDDDDEEAEEEEDDDGSDDDLASEPVDEEQENDDMNSDEDAASASTGRRGSKRSSYEAEDNADNSDDADVDDDDSTGRLSNSSGFKPKLRAQTGGADKAIPGRGSGFAARKKRRR